MYKLASAGLLVVVVGCGGGVPGGPADLALPAGADLAQGPSADLDGVDGGGADMVDTIDMASTDLAGADLSTPPDMTQPCGVNPGDACCSSGAPCPGNGSGVTLVCMNASPTSGVVDKRCMLYVSASCGSETQSCCNVNGQPQSSGNYCSLGGVGQPVEYCINGTCQ